MLSDLLSNLSKSKNLLKWPSAFCTACTLGYKPCTSQKLQEQALWRYKACSIGVVQLLWCNNACNFKKSQRVIKGFVLYHCTDFVLVTLNITSTRHFLQTISKKRTLYSGRGQKKREFGPKVTGIWFKIILFPRISRNLVQKNIFGPNSRYFRVRKSSSASVGAPEV